MISNMIYQLSKISYILYLIFLKGDPLEIQNPKIENSSLDQSLCMRDYDRCHIPHATKLSWFERYSALKKIVNFYSFKGQENVNITTLIRCTGIFLQLPHGRTT